MTPPPMRPDGISDFAYCICGWIVLAIFAAPFVAFYWLFCELVR